MTKSRNIGRGGARPNTGKVKTFFRFKAIPENLPKINQWEELGFSSLDEFINHQIAKE
jgi:hypothetical protein